MARSQFLQLKKRRRQAALSELRMMWIPTFDLIKRFLFDVFVVVSFSMMLVRLLVLEWRSLRRLFSTRRR